MSAVIGGLGDERASRALIERGGSPHVIDSLKASTACPYFLFNGQPISWYNCSIGVLVFSATCLIIDATILPLLKRSSHLTISSGDTRRFERSMYPCTRQLSPSSIGAGDFRADRTLLFVYSQHDHNLIPSNADELLYASNTPSRKLGEQDHAIDIIILE